MRRPTTALALQASGLLIAAATVLAPVAADAAFPGTNGRVVFDSSRNGAVNVYSVDPSNTADVRLHTTSTNIDEIPFGSPDGTRLVFRSDRANPGNGQGNIYLVSGQTNLDVNTLPPDNAIALTTGGADDTDPSFVDDATVVYSHKDTGGNYRLFTVAIATQVSTPLLTPPAGCDDRQAVVNPVNTNVFAFARICSGVSHLMIYDRSVAVSGTNPKDLTLANTSSYAITQDFEPDWAPDGSRIAVSASGPTQFGGFTQLYSVLPDGTGRLPFWPTLVNGTGKNDRFPAYSPDGTKLTFTRAATTTGTDVWTTELASLNSTSTATTTVDLTPARGPDQHPTWLRVSAPTPVIPEIPVVPALTVSATLLLLGGVLHQRRRVALR